MSELHEITDILEQLIHEHERVLKLAKQKKEVLITGAIADLARIIQFEARSIKNIQALELERERYVSLYFMKRGMRRDTYYLSDLIEHAGDTTASRSLQTCQVQLTETLKELQSLNKLNQQLIEQSLALVNHTIEELTAPPENEPVYSRPNASIPYHRASQRFFDNKA